ncbi:hypothetical protein HAX54_042883 [Datura stramonium]|uniref:Uncharacterized protein n=1 Tax=Datura stramonium TaxID=4076 RepID=A0ABS8W416_DATST|nr:hypothetical protein [Datura stramonium]
MPKGGVPIPRRGEKEKKKENPVIEKIGNLPPVIIISNENSEEFGGKLRVQKFQVPCVSYTEDERLFLYMENFKQNHSQIVAPMTIGKSGSCNAGRVPVGSRNLGASSLGRGDLGIDNYLIPVILPIDRQRMENIFIEFHLNNYAHAIAKDSVLAAKGLQCLLKERESLWLKGSKLKEAMILI